MSEVDATLRRLKVARNKANSVLKSPNSSEFEQEDAVYFLKSIESFINSICKYTESVFRLNKNKKMSNINFEEKKADDVKKEADKLEFNRSIAHNDVITNVKLLDSYCRDFGVEEIYGKIPKEYEKETDGILKHFKEKKGVFVQTNHLDDNQAKIRHNIADWAWNVTLGSTVELELKPGDEFLMEALRNVKGIIDPVIMEKIGEIYERRIGGATGAAKRIKEMTGEHEK